MAFDKDRDDNAFELYEKLYKGMPWDLFDFKNKYSDSNGYFVKLKKIEECDPLTLGKYKGMVEKHGGVLCLSGDADFGMKIESTFVKNEKSYEQVKDYFEEKPEDLMHKESNFSLMVVNGGMNCRKGLRNCFRDIFPRFLYSVAEYYKITDEHERKKYAKENLCKISVGRRHKKGETKAESDAKKEELHKKFKTKDLPALVCFLNTFVDYEDYFIKMYFWGVDSKEIRELSSKIISFGETVDNKSFYQKENIEKYCKLAEEYWEIREEIMKKVINS